MEREKQKAYPKAFDKLREKAMVESVKASNAIEQITEIVNGAKPQTHDEEEIAGYSDALNEIYMNHERTVC